MKKNQVGKWQNKYNCKGPPEFKVKEKDISLSKNSCITITTQKISSIHKFILQIQLSIITTINC